MSQDTRHDQRPDTTELVDWDFAADGPPTSSTMPHPTPQYAQSVFTVVTMASTVPGAVCAAITHRLAGYDVVLTGRRTRR